MNSLEQRAEMLKDVDQLFEFWETFQSILKNEFGLSPAIAVILGLMIPAIIIISTKKICKLIIEYIKDR